MIPRKLVRWLTVCKAAKQAIAKYRFTKIVAYPQNRIFTSARPLTTAAKIINTSKRPHTDTLVSSRPCWIDMMASKTIAKTAATDVTIITLSEFLISLPTFLKLK